MVNSVNNLNPAASQLLNQIRRLSSQVNQKEIDSPPVKNSVTNNHAAKIKEMLENAKLGGIEKTQKKNEVFAQMVKDIKKEDTGKNIQTVDMLKTSEPEKKRYRNPLGSFLDAYL